MLLAVAVLATTTSVAFAADSAIYDVQYLPKAGTTYGQTEWQYLQTEVEISNDDGSKSDGWNLQQTIGHSFTDRLSVEGLINYTDVTNDPEDSTENDSDQTGISDPTVQARFRAMDEQWRLDIIGGAKISLGDSEFKSNGDSNNLDGGNELFLGTQIGQKSENMQWAVLGQYNRVMESTTDFKGAGGGKVKDDAYGQWTFRGDILNKLAEKSYLRSHLSAIFTPEYNDDETPEGTVSSSTTYEIGTQYQHLFSQDLLGLAGVDYQTVNVSSGQVDSVTGWRFSVGARYQF